MVSIGQKNLWRQQLPNSDSLSFHYIVEFWFRSFKTDGSTNTVYSPFHSLKEGLLLSMTKQMFRSLTSQLFQIAKFFRQILGPHICVFFSGSIHSCFHGPNPIQIQHDCQTSLQHLEQFWLTQKIFLAVSQHWRITAGMSLYGIIWARLGPRTQTYWAKSFILLSGIVPMVDLSYKAF